MGISSINLKYVELKRYKKLCKVDGGFNIVWFFITLQHYIFYFPSILLSQNFTFLIISLSFFLTEIKSKSTTPTTATQS